MAHALATVVSCLVFRGQLPLHNSHHQDAQTVASQWPVPSCDMPPKPRGAPRWDELGIAVFSGSRTTVNTSWMMGAASFKLVAVGGRHEFRARMSQVAHWDLIIAFTSPLLFVFLHLIFPTLILLQLCCVAISIHLVPAALSYTHSHCQRANKRPQLYLPLAPSREQLDDSGLRIQEAHSYSSDCHSSNNSVHSP